MRNLLSRSMSRNSPGLLLIRLRVTLPFRNSATGVPTSGFCGTVHNTTSLGFTFLLIHLKGRPKKVHVRRRLGCLHRRHGLPRNVQLMCPLLDCVFFSFNSFKMQTNKGSHLVSGVRDVVSAVPIIIVKLIFALELHNFDHMSKTGYPKRNSSGLITRKVLYQITHQAVTDDPMTTPRRKRLIGGGRIAAHTIKAG